MHDFAHIGNFRTFVFADLVRRYLEFKGYILTHVMNLTDVEDKIIKRVRESGSSREEYTARYEAEFFKDFDALGCSRPQQTPRATGHIDEIISLIDKLIARGIAYKAADGSVYFSIEKYRGCGCQYGQLVKLNFDEMRPGERVSSDEYAKESIADFALWKARAPEDGQVFWPSPWGEGRPGWHIECSAMSMKILGPSFDLHLGGEDLIFPHHEDEIAQSEGAGVQRAGERFVKYWLHGAHLMVEGKKMSKSLGNFFTLRELIEKKKFTGREVRYLLLTAHYRESFNFTLEGLQSARTALARIDECVGKLQELAGHTISPADRTVIEEFTAALDDDLNVSSGWRVVFDWVKATNKALAAEKLSLGGAKTALATWYKMREVWGLEAGKRSSKVLAEAVSSSPGHLTVPIQDASNENLSQEIADLVRERHKAKTHRDFKRADAIRNQLKAKGWAIEDTPKGPRAKPV